mgnify:FL=1
MCLDINFAHTAKPENTPMILTDVQPSVHISAALTVKNVQCINGLTSRKNAVFVGTD